MRNGTTRIGVITINTDIKSSINAAKRRHKPTSFDESIINFLRGNKNINAAKMILKNRLVNDDDAITLQSSLKHSEETPIEPPENEELKKAIPIMVRKANILGMINPFQFTICFPFSLCVRHT